MKTTSNEKPHQNMWKWNIFSNLKLKIIGPNQNEKFLLIKTTANRRQPQNLKHRISQQPLIESSSNLKLKLSGPNQN